MNASAILRLDPTPADDSADAASEDYTAKPYKLLAIIGRARPHHLIL